MNKKTPKWLLNRMQTNDGATYCRACSKFAWPNKELAVARIEKAKLAPRVRKRYLLDSYRCPLEKGWHVGHDYKLQWISVQW